MPLEEQQEKTEEEEEEEGGSAVQILQKEPVFTFSFRKGCVQICILYRGTSTKNESINVSGGGNEAEITEAPLARSDKLADSQRRNVSLPAGSQGEKPEKGLHRRQIREFAAASA